MLLFVYTFFCNYIIKLIKKCMYNLTKNEKPNNWKQTKSMKCILLQKHISKIYKATITGEQLWMNNEYYEKITYNHI